MTLKTYKIWKNEVSTGYTHRGMRVHCFSAAILFFWPPSCIFLECSIYRNEFLEPWKHIKFKKMKFLRVLHTEIMRVHCFSAAILFFGRHLVFFRMLYSQKWIPCPWKHIKLKKCSSTGYTHRDIRVHCFSAAILFFWPPSCISSNVIFTEMNSLTLKTYKINKKWSSTGSTHRDMRVHCFSAAILFFGRHLGWNNMYSLCPAVFWKLSTWPAYTKNFMLVSSSEVFLAISGWSYRTN